MEKRKDNKGRILRDGEYQKSDGRYEFRYSNHRGELKSVYSWRLVETDKTPAGKRTTDSLREMEKAIRRDLEDGIVVGKEITLNNVWDSYIVQKVEAKKSTVAKYKYIYNRHIRNTIGCMSIATIKYSTIKTFFNDLMCDKGFKPSSVKMVYAMLHPVFKLAVRDGYIRINPTDDVIADLKKSHDWEIPKRHSLTIPQQTAFIDCVAKHKTYKRWLPLFTVLLGTGCRIGEMLGLRWEDIDWENNVISINHNLVRYTPDNGGPEYHITTPKTKNGIREIPMLTDVRQALICEQQRQTQIGFCQTEIDGYSGFIWQSNHGQLCHPCVVDQMIQRIIHDYNKEETETAKRENREVQLLPHFSAHNLRHTFCTRLCENESDLKIIQEVMGHADIATTMNVYNESNTSRKKASFAKLEGVMKIS